MRIVIAAAALVCAAGIGREKQRCRTSARGLPAGFPGQGGDVRAADHRDDPRQAAADEFHHPGRGLDIAQV